ncbi:MAG: hypothetical protein ABIJ47_03950 [Candidatus Bathyarchaeota archaeon]
MSLALSLKTPEEIRPGEVVSYWEQLAERTPHDCYAVYRSPNRELRAWVDEATTTVALMWNVHTGQVHQVDTKALYPLISKLGGWI